MFDRIRGELEEARADHVLIASDPFTYKVYVSLRTIQELPTSGTNILLYLYPIFKENDIILYGFDDDLDREIFTDLLSVNKIGPKIAIAILSLYSRDEIIQFIHNGKVKDLMRAPGLGKRGAEMIITTLKDKYKGKEFSQLEETEGAIERLRVNDQIFNDAVSALTGLGYSWEVASEAVRESYSDEKSLEEIIKDSLVAMNI